VLGDSRYVAVPWSFIEEIKPVEILFNLKDNEELKKAQRIDEAFIIPTTNINLKTMEDVDDCLKYN